MRTQEEILQDVELGMKVCGRCGIRKDFDKFYNNRRTLDKKMSSCKQCSDKSNRKFVDANKDKVATKQRIQKIKKMYNLTEVQYVDMMNKQRGCCAICRDSLYSIHIDHCHKTKKVRGLLCSNCNTAIGKLKDNSSICLSAAKYLEGDT